MNRPGLNSKSALLLKHCLVFCLTLNVSGVLPVVGQITKAHADPSPLLKSASDEGNEINELLRTQVRRTRHPGTPGTLKGTTHYLELVHLEVRLKRWKAEVERVLALPDEEFPKPEPRNEEAPSPSQIRRGTINSYLLQLTQLTSLRIAMDLEAGPSWRADFALQVPQALVGEIPGMGTLASNRLGDRYLPMVIEGNTQDPGAPVKLQLSNSLVQGLELSRLADVQNNDTNLTMIKYLATRQLLANLADLRYVSKNHEVSIPKIPGPLRSKLKSLGLAAEIAEEQHRAVAEPGARLALLQGFSSIAATLPSFTTPQLVSSVADAAGSTPKQRELARRPLQEILGAAETQNLTAALEQEIGSASLPLSTQNPNELDDTLRSILATAKANTQLVKILELIESKTLNLSVEKRRTIMAALDARKASYPAELSGQTIRAWQDGAKQLSTELLFGEQRRHFIQDVLYRAPEAVALTRKSVTEDTVNLAFLSQVYAPELAALAPSEQAGAWIQEIRSASSYLSARTKYNEIVLREVAPDLLTTGMINAPRATAIINTRDFSPKEIPVTKNTDPRIADNIRARAGHNRRADLHALIKYGTWMGFHRVYSKKPSVAEVVTDKDRASAYFEQVDAAVTRRYPILAVKIPFESKTRKKVWRMTNPALSNYGGAGWVADEVEVASHESSLAEVLVSINPKGICDAATEEKASLLIDQALVKIEERIRKNIVTVGEAKNAGEIEKVLTTSMMLSVVMQGFPEFRQFEERFLEDLMSPSLLDQLMRRYAGPAMMYGFGAMMLIMLANGIGKHVIKFAYPITNTISVGFNSLMAGYLHGAMILIVADSAYQIKEVLHQRSQRQQQEDFFSCSVDGACFTDVQELRAANSAYSFAKTMLVARFVMDFFLMYLPWGRGIYAKSGEKVAMKEFMADKEAFQQLGLESGEFSNVERAMKLATAIREKRALDSEFIHPKAGDDGAWLHVRKGEAIELGDGYHFQADATGWIRVADAQLLARLAPQFMHDATSGIVSLATAEGWTAFEQSYSRLAAKIATGQTYRLVSVYERIAVEDAFRALQLNPAKPSSWLEIQQARALQERGTGNLAEIGRINRAANFLEKYLAEMPHVVREGLPEVSRAERRLTQILKKGPDAELIWAGFEILKNPSLKLAPVGGAN